MNCEGLYWVQQLYENSVFRTALFSPKGELLWSNAQDFYSDFQEITLDSDMPVQNALGNRQQPDLKSLQDFLRVTKESRFTIHHMGERYHFRVVPIYFDDPQQMESAGAPTAFLLQASGISEFHKIYGWINTGNETMRQIAGVRTAISEIVATNTVLYSELEKYGKYDLLQLLTNQISSCYKALSTSINLAEMVKYSTGFYHQTRSNVSVFLEDILSVCSAYLRESGVEIVRHIQPDICMELDFDKFTSVVLNLVVNAVQNNISEEKRVVVSLKKTRREIVFSVEDNGIGIPTEKIALLFIPHALSEKYSEKSGLGLPLCKMFADHYGAAVTVSSQTDVGTQIFMRFPRCEQGDCDDVPRLDSPAKKYVSERFSPLYVYLSKVVKIRIV